MFFLLLKAILDLTGRVEAKRQAELSPILRRGEDLIDGSEGYGVGPSPIRSIDRRICTGAVSLAFRYGARTISKTVFLAALVGYWASCFVKGRA